MTYELSPSDRITFSTKRIYSLRQGKGDYAPSERQAEIERTQDALHAAYADQRRAWISAQ